MATQNDFLPFATGPGANVVDQATYAALGALTTGFLSGTAQSAQVNKVCRQSSIMAAVIAQFIVAQTGQAAVDDGTTATLLANFTKAVNAASKQRVILPDSGSVNAYAAANPVPMTSLPTVSGIVQTISVKTTNTGASTYSPDGLASRPIFGLGGVALQGGEMVANGIATLVSYVGPLLNGGSLCWVLFECIGGAQQVAAATQSQHAVPLGQATGRLLNIQVFQNAGTSTYTPTPGTTAVYVRVQGGGGSGGGAPATGASQISIGSGGQAGAYAESWITSGFSGAAVTVGAGGAGIAGFGGNNGGASSFGSFVTAPGGGAGSSAGPTAVPFATGVSGSSIATGGNVLNSTGAPGSPTVAISTSVGIPGPGASSVFGGGGGSASVGSAGQSAGSFGAGGGGCMQTPSGAALAGGNGKPGIVIVYEYGSR
ncbi:putative exported phage protein [Burkholderia multivorans]|uniref:glycine-rich domain-containing protein n=1 Tax=Burkholderia multivorans TaxID=87883 RepID=UPI0019827DDF|nr:hypothetical protein [Burkholderia multivorans]CAB5279527.1 putative exported phage protein [Burkholderia multivorans]CAB5285973.1 putative exported phage protein [Burkholderia multivorans]CAB5287515.1 putative exported phage protein [Burkholderia multivorans]CAB5288554.1 putative exported phage protein [Burkholderia multivorans]CAB5292411.1 putative exported phage protein [Burkholderia multivorans]